jgi:riboflavin kinase/FMN adenylyltransferase
VVVDFIAWIRGEEKFDSLDALSSAMMRDCQQAREILERVA